MVTIFFCAFLFSDIVIMIFLAGLGLVSFFLFSSSFTLRTSLYFDFLGFTLFLLVLITFFTAALCVFFERARSSSWCYLFFLLFFLLTSLFYLFSCVNLFFFYLLFEFTVLPTFILIIGWGYRVNRIQASFYMVLYMLTSSYPFLLAILYIKGFGLPMSFLFSLFSLNYLVADGRNLWWFLFILVFATKLPLFFLHLWLPKAHVDAPLLGSMILAGVLLKIGGFGLYRVRVFFFAVFLNYLWAFSVYCLVGSIIISFLCLRQLDLKSLVAYSSIVHMGPVFCCFFTITYCGVVGSFLLIFSHGLCSCALFFLVNLIYNWLFSRSLFVMRGGVILRAVFFYFWSLFCFFNMGCPPSFNFFSEILVLFSCLVYGQFFFLLFFFVILFVGFYCVIMLISPGHGEPFVVGFSSFVPLKLLDCCGSLLFSLGLFFFVFLLSIFSC